MEVGANAGKVWQALSAANAAVEVKASLWYNYCRPQ